MQLQSRPGLPRATHRTAADTPDPTDPTPRQPLGVRGEGPGPGAVRGAAIQGRGAQAAAMANHVRRLKLYPEPQTGGRRGGAEPGRGRRSFPQGHAPRLQPTNHKRREACPYSHAPSRLNRPEGRARLKGAAPHRRLDRGNLGESLPLAPKGKIQSLGREGRERGEVSTRGLGG